MTRDRQEDLMRNWANTHGKCVRQRTVLQETTKYKAGTLPLNMYQTAVHRGEFAPVEGVEQPEFSKEEGREGAPTSRDQGDSSNTMTTPPTTTLMILHWNKMLPFVICRTRKLVSFLHRAEREVDG